MYSTGPEYPIRDIISGIQSGELELDLSNIKEFAENYDLEDPDDNSENGFLNTPKKVLSFLKKHGFSSIKDLIKNVSCEPLELDTEGRESGELEDLQRELKKFKKQGWKYWGDINMDGYYCKLFTKKPMNIGEIECDRPFSEYEDYILEDEF